MCLRGKSWRVFQALSLPTNDWVEYSVQHSGCTHDNPQGEPACAAISNSEMRCESLKTAEAAIVCGAPFQRCGSPRSSQRQLRIDMRLLRL